VYDKVVFFLLFSLLFLQICLLMNLDELRKSGVGCYIYYMFMGIMYADDIILLSGSLNDLHSMLKVCHNVGTQLLLKFNTNKCKCIAFDKMAKSAMSGHHHLGIHFKCGKRLQVDTDPIRRRFYAASNSIFMNASHQDQLLQLHLLTYHHGALSLSNAQLSDLNVCWNNLYRKLFHFHRWESVRVFINGIGKLDFLHLSKLITAKFFKHLSISPPSFFTAILYMVTSFYSCFTS